MANIQSLPIEVLIAVFIFLGSAESIGECRLVCKYWNDPAAKAMFEKPLHLCLYNEVKRKKLMEYLTKDQTKGQHVKYLSLCHYDNNILEAILPFLFTSNIRELGGDDTDMLYRLITKIAQESITKFDKLSVIPSTYYFTDSYSKALSTFKNSLTTVDITLDEIPDSPTHLMNQLNKFKCLTTLTVKAPFGNIAELEQIIGRCLQLQQLQLSTEAYVQYDGTPMDVATLSTWPVNNANFYQVTSLKNLSIVSAGFPHFVQYLMFKYPNMQSITLNIHETDAYITTNTEQLIEPLKNVANYTLTYRITVGDAITTIFNTAKSDINIVKIGYHHVLGGTLTIVMTIEGKESQELNHETTFSVHIPPNANTKTHAWYLSQVHMPADHLEIDLLNYRDFDVDDRNDFYRKIAVKDENVVFFNILFDYPDAENIRFIARDISDCTDFYFSNHYTRLKSLEICGAQLSPATSLALTDMCRELSVLNLVNCPILRQNGIVRINMEHNAFQQFTYRLMPCNYFTRDMDDSDNEAAVEYAERTLLALELYYSRETYLWLRIRKTNRAMYLKIMPNDSYRYLITKKQFYLRSPKARAIQFSCFSVRHLLLDLDSIRLQIDEEYLDYALTSPLSSEYNSAEDSDMSDF
ncbi:uncharacterized protein ATC70_003978 [Mucor velutinosus]|uniref:F-box domain-containing protein n=1 Tax=Mucor velutinosus TaxID=708070 RepID=A0AAN7D8P9_9FUNG|nr:hypothetical protein ATC70_003978 [Mucor velutinosus]